MGKRPVYIDNTEVKSFVTSAKSAAPNVPSSAVEYVKSLVPLASWIGRYNLSWFAGDVIAGLTVGFLVLPQALAQAKIATLPPEYGLYTAFVGLVLYAFFSTGKDATIGPTAVLSLLTSQVLATANKDGNGKDVYPPVVFAVSLAFIAGVYELVLGLLRLGILVEFIPSTVISGFTTGAATTIILGQVPKLLGIKGIDTNTQPSYFILRDIFQKLGTIKVDAAIGLTCVLFLALLKYARDRYGKRSKWIYYVGIARNGIALVIYLLVSYLVTRFAYKGKPPFALVGDIPRGFKSFQAPTLDAGIVSRVVTPAITVALVGIVEHVAISKSFGRQEGYVINPSQEMVALGLTNVFGSFLSGYPATGSFSRSAVKAASGVRTPAAGFITATVVVIALYFLTPVFYFIPEAVLSAVIIVSISDLISRYPTFIEFWNVSFWDFLVSITALLVTIFSSIENGIYSSVIFALVILLVRIARPYLSTLGKLATGAGHYVSLQDPSLSTHSPPAGVLIFRIEESLTYPNSAYITEKILEFVRHHTAFGGEKRKPGDRLWCDDTEERAAALIKNKGLSASLEKLPVLKAVIFDFSSVNAFDVAAYQAVFDLKKATVRYSGQIVDFHFVNVKPHIRRVLVNLLSTPLDVADILPIFNLDEKETVTEIKDPGRFIHADIDDAVAAASTKSDSDVKSAETAV
ncbi:hypothetical protein HK102_005265 [Quaeritorhiza haematococci]|nr:hypothetical protein HK102_005265 [Quaeritorhiza haematococci]